ncbi:MAG: nucleoside triphosphate pyrophosphohydrolase [Rhodospirillaceae bacterium]|nr:nucleoside triphosphate pyrophosphohydrolase [Rhodospirillaceae bacterium]
MTDSADSSPGGVDRLLAIMAKLRDPDDGCPWDLEQTFATIAPYTIEEAYEVSDAIESGDMAALRDELGDLLFQVVFYAQMAREIGAFDFDAVVDGICDKMIRRHPHVFGQADIRSAEMQTVAWEAHKAAERAADENRAGVLDGVAQALPALLRAAKLQKRAARVGFDWPSIAPVFDKLDEEVTELRMAMADESGQDAVAEELGDLLFVCANLGRHAGVDPEDALRRANAKFERRFRRIEALLAAEGRSPEDSDLAEMDALWDRAKREERE